MLKHCSEFPEDSQVLRRHAGLTVFWRRAGPGAGTGETVVTAVGRRRVQFPTMKKLLELLVCFLHPVAVILMWINLAGRSDLTGLEKVVWAVFGLIPLVPFLYVLVGGDLW